MAEALPTTLELLDAAASILEAPGPDGALTGRQVRLALHLLRLARDDLAAPAPQLLERLVASLGAVDETDLCEQIDRGHHDADLRAVVAALRPALERTSGPYDPDRDPPKRSDAC